MRAKTDLAIPIDGEDVHLEQGECVQLSSTSSSVFSCSCADLSLFVDRLLAIEVSYKYLFSEAVALFHLAGFRLVQHWTDSSRSHYLYLVEKPRMWFPATKTSSAQMLGIELDEDERVNDYGVPSLSEWEGMWKAWDGLMVRRPCPPPPRPSPRRPRTDSAAETARHPLVQAPLHQADPAPPRPALLPRPHPRLPRHPPLALPRRTPHRAGPLCRHLRARYRPERRHGQVRALAQRGARRPGRLAERAGHLGLRRAHARARQEGLRRQRGPLDEEARAGPPDGVRARGVRLLSLPPRARS